jgi:DNA-binding LytR/AlgR family response regulator
VPPYHEIFYIGILLNQNSSIMLTPIFVWKDRTLEKIHPELIVRLVTEKNYTKIYLVDIDTPYMVRSTLSNALKKLPEEIFIKTHRSYAVSVLYINFIARDHLQVGSEIVPIAKQYYRSVMEKLVIIE